MKSIPAALSIPLLLLAGAACAPSIDAAAKADVDRKLAELKPAERVIGAPAAPQPLALAVGQWATYKVVDDKGRPGLFTQKIVGQESDAFWVETVNESYFGKSVTAMLLAFGDRKDPKTVEIRAVKLKDKDGRVTEQPKEILSLTKSIYDGIVSQLVVRWENLPQETATTPAGQFTSCYKLNTEAKWGQWNTKSIVWGHSEVPISGTVRSEAEDNTYMMELVDFGTTGATSEVL